MEFVNVIESYNLYEIYMMRDSTILLIVDKYNARLYCRNILNSNMALTPCSDGEQFMEIKYEHDCIYRSMYIDLSSIYNPKIRDFGKNELYYFGRLSKESIKTYLELQERWNSNHSCEERSMSECEHTEVIHTESDKNNSTIKKHRICDEEGNMGYEHILRLGSVEPIVRCICEQSLENRTIPIDSIVYAYVVQSKNEHTTWNIEKIQKTTDAGVLLSILDAYFKIMPDC